MLDKALTVAAAKAKLAGLVVAAAAIGGTAVAAGSTAFVPTAGEDPVTTAPTESPSPSVSPDATVTDPTAAPTPAGTEAPTAQATRTPLPCPSDVANHGSYVSQVAKDKSVTGREHGQAVSEAATSDCGKPADDAAAAEPADTEESEAPEVEATEAPDADEQGDDEQGDEQGDDEHGDATADTHSPHHGHGHDH